jgi:hypothetical protein
VVDHVVVPRHRVAGDLAQIDAWVIEHGGRIDTLPGQQSQTLTGGRWQRPHSEPPSQWHVVPGTALDL